MNRYDQASHLTQDTTGESEKTQLNITNKRQGVSLQLLSETTLNVMINLKYIYLWVPEHRFQRLCQ